MNEIAELTRFREAMPDDPAARMRARNRLVSRTLGSRPAPRTPRIRRRLVIAAAAAAVVAAGGVVAVDSLLIGDRPVGASAEAATLLRQAADAAIGSTDPAVGPDEYLRVTTMAVYASLTQDESFNEVGWLEISTDELFMPGDPAAEWVLRRSPRVPYRPEDAALAAEHGVAGGMEGFTQRGAGAIGTGDWQSPTPEFLAGLPRDPAELLDLIHRDAGDAGPSRDGEALVYVADVLRSGIVPGDLRAALFQAAALIPGVELVDDQANLNGRTGVAVGRYESANGQRQEIIFDPETGLVIGEREILVDHGIGPLLPVGTAWSWTAVTTDVVPADVVDAIPADPLD
jgi:hypothetical protein